MCIQRVAAEDQRFANYTYCKSGGIPIPISNEGSCAQGFYCPNLVPNQTETWPSVCTPTPECQFQRLANQYCEPQGRYEPQLCLPGHYCPNSSQMLQCPERSWCIRGSSEPRPCGPMTYCPAGTSIGRFYGGLLAILLIDVALVWYWLWRRYVGEPRAIQRAQGERREKLLQAYRALLQQQGADSDMLGPMIRHAAAGPLSSQSDTPLPPWKSIKRDVNTVLVGVRMSLQSTWARTVRVLPEGMDAVVDFTGVKGLRVRTRSMRRASGSGPLFPGLVSMQEEEQTLEEPSNRRRAAFPPSGLGLGAGSSPEDGAGRADRIARMGDGQQGRRDNIVVINPVGPVAAQPGNPSDGDSPVASESSDSTSGPLPHLEAQLTEAAVALLSEAFRSCNAGLTLDLEFDSLGLTLPAPLSKTILSGVSGRIVHNRVTAIMGPSGAGKTTFLSVLMGRIARTQGVLRINGKPGEMKTFKRLTGFVPQDDVMLRELTVRENIEHAARVRLPRVGWTAGDIGRHVDAVIQVLGLTACADTVTARISGGQRKRTNIGMELAVCPTALFLDEPTSGLDSTAALEVCNTLKTISQLGLTVVAVIHQPRAEIFASFDDLLLLAPGGHTVYMGEREGVTAYFQAAGLPIADSAAANSLLHVDERNVRGNPADDLLDCIAGRDAQVVPLDKLLTVAKASRNSILLQACSTAVQGGKPSATLKGMEVPAYLVARWSVHHPAPAAPKEAAVGSIPEYTGRPLVGGPTAFAWAVEKVRRLSGHALAAGQAAMIELQSMVPSVPGVSGRPAAVDPEVAARQALMMQRGAPFYMQFYLCFMRSLTQQYRQASWLALELCVCVLAGAMMGVSATSVPELYIGVLAPPYSLISPAPLEIIIPSLGFYINMAAGVAGAPAAVRTFCEERDVYQREFDGGHDLAAYYLAKNAATAARLFLSSLHFAAVFTLLALPTTDFGIIFLMVLGIFWGVYGLSILLGLVVNRSNAALLAVIGTLVMACLCGFGPNLQQGRRWGIDPFQDMSYSRWATELFMHSETLPYRSLFLVKEVSASVFGYTLDRPGFDVAMMLVIAVVQRVLAFLILEAQVRLK